MNDWRSTYLGRDALPRDSSGFEIEAFFSTSPPTTGNVSSIICGGCRTQFAHWESLSR
jgi:hypothetical protein